MQLPEFKPQPQKIKNIFFYLKEAFRFHEVGIPYFVQILFVLMLAILFGGYVFALPYAEEMNRISAMIMTKLQETAASGNPDAVNLSGVVTPEIMERMITSLGNFLIWMLTAKTIVQALSLFYAFVYHQKRVMPATPFGGAVRGFVAILPKLILSNLLFYGLLLLAGVAMSVVFAVIGLVLPPLALLLAGGLPILFLVATSLFVFRDLSVMVGNAGPIRSFSAAWRLTNGCRRVVVGNMMMMYIIGMVVSWISVGISRQTLVATFAAAFFEALLLLVSQRLSVRMYEDAREMVIKETHSVVSKE